tara:strand:- start:6 stop:365 length:360 start_codon:yes stop_codon:yes gene_type:complete
MKLSDKQNLFAQKITMLEAWLTKKGIKYVRGEAYRSPEEAKRLQEIGRGILNSNHCIKLAQDLIIFNEEGDPWDYDAYVPAGKCWVALDPLCRWGGNFTGGSGPGRDAPHFSFIHNGVQ